MHGAMAPARLRRAREEAGLHIEVLASALKVPVHRLEALEEGRYEELPDMVFARALASSACRHLHIDPGPVLDEIPTPGAPTLGEIPRAISAPFRTSAVDLGGSASSGSGGMKTAASIAGILVVAAVVVALLPEGMPWSGWLGSAARDGAVAEPAAPVNDAPFVAPVLEAPAGSALNEAPAAEAPAAEDAATSPATLPVAPQATATPVSEVVAPGAGAAPAGTSLLVLTVRGDSWVEVTNGRRAVVVQRMMRAGDVLDFSSDPPYTVVLGRADQVEVTVRGQPFNVLPLARNSVARFEVK